MNELRPEGETSTTVAVGVNGGKVVLQFPQAVRWVALDPHIAAQVADAMLGAAIDNGAQIKIDMPERKYTPQQIVAMHNRTRLVINNMIERKAKPDHVAQEIVDIILTMAK